MLDKLVQKFLTENVEVMNSWDGDNICFIGSNEFYHFGMLTYDINLIFGISAEEIKNIIERWLKEFYPLVSLDNYFKISTNVIYAPHISAQYPFIII